MDLIVPQCCDDARCSGVVYSDNRSRWLMSAHANDAWALSHGESRADDRDGNAYPVDCIVRFCPFCGSKLPDEQGKTYDGTHGATRSASSK